MAANSKIEWTEFTWNAITGCSKVSLGCEYCYALTMANRHEGIGTPGYKGTTNYAERKKAKEAGKPLPKLNWSGKINQIESALEIPLKRRKPTMFFVNSMSDLFHEKVSFEFIDKIFAIMSLCPQHTFQILTKRPDRALEYFKQENRVEEFEKNADDMVQKWYEIAKREYDALPLPWFWDISYGDYGEKDADLLFDSEDLNLSNVQLGVSVENQQTADERIPILLQIPAAVRFLSCEPLLGGIDLTKYLTGENNETKKHGDDNYQIFNRHGVGNRRAGQDMENCTKEMEQMGTKNSFNTMQKKKGGTSIGKILSNKGNDKSSQDTPNGAEISVGESEREDTRRDDNQSYKRETIGQSTGKLGISNNERTNDTCDTNIGSTSEQECIGSISWVIVGGESGHGARPCHPDWVRKIRDDCKAAGVPFFFKQWGEWLPSSQCNDYEIFDEQFFADNFKKPYKYIESPYEKDDNVYIRTGKKVAGHLLDGKKHREFPK